MKSLSFVIFFLRHKLRRLTGASQKLGDLEKRFCKENSIDADRVLKSHFFELFGNFDQRLLAVQIEAMVIPKRKRFGNALLQLADAYNIARQLGVKKIYHRGYSFLKDEATVGDIQFIKGVPSKHENYLIGDFYDNTSLLSVCQNKLDRWKIVHNMSESIRLDLRQEEPSSVEDVLHIHLRSGDIFKKTPPHRDYGQPPLALYTKIIRMRAWRKVVMVFEDQYNPVINALIEFVKQQGIAYETHSGDIHQDVEVLLGAKHLVIARGTFIYPILSLSKNAKEVFYFEIDELSPWGLQHSHIAFRKCVDERGDYRSTILTCWDNSPEQNALMLSYPESSLKIEEASFQ